MGTLASLWYREFKIWSRSPLMVGVAIAQPLLYLVLLGSAIGNMVGEVIFYGEQIAYMAYITPGMMALAAVGTALEAGLGIYLDRRTHMFEELLTSTSGRHAYMGAKILFGITLALIQAAVILAIALPILGEHMLHFNIPLVLASMVLGAICFSSLGMALSSAITSNDLFNATYNLIWLPIIFCSSIFYDVGKMPTWMKCIVTVNPLTYTVETMRAGVFGVWNGQIATDLLILAAIAAGLFCVAVAAYRRIRI